MATTTTPCDDTSSDTETVGRHPIVHAMPPTRSTRNRMLISTITVLAIGGAVIAWEWYRDGSTLIGGRSAAAVPVDPAALQQVFDDPQLRALVPLAPPVEPKQLGNPNPFTVLEER